VHGRGLQGTAQNIGDAAVPSSVVSTVGYKFNGKDQGTQKFTLAGPVPVGQTRMFGVNQKQVPAGTTTMEVTVNVDSDGKIDEGVIGNKQNNLCTLTFTTKVTPQRQQR
jgi:hypothetical protein